MKTPTEKQIKLVEEITSVLKIDFPNNSFQFTRKEYFKFIQKHLPAFKELIENDFYDEELLDWLGLYENDVWCEHY